MQTEADVDSKKEELAQSLFDHIPVGVGSQGIIPTTAKDLEDALEMGMDWSLREVCPAISLSLFPPVQLIKINEEGCIAARSLSHLPAVPHTGYRLSVVVNCVPPGLCMGRGQGALRGVWPLAVCRSHQGQSASQEARPLTGESLGRDPCLCAPAAFPASPYMLASLLT